MTQHTTGAAVLARVVVPLVAVGYMVGIALVQHGFADPAIAPTRNGDPWALAMHVAAGIALVGGGIITLLLGVTNRSGLVATLAGMAWFGPMLPALIVDQPLLRALGAGSAALILPLIAHAVLSVSAPGAPSRRSAKALAMLYVMGGVVSIALLMTYAPYFDVRCVEACRSRESISGLGSSGWTLARAAAGAVTIASGILIGTACVRRILTHHSSVPGGTLALVGGALVGVAAATGAALGLMRGFGVAVPMATREGIEVAVSIASSLGALGVALAVLRAGVRTFAAHQRMRDIAEGMATAPDPGFLGAALATALGDPTVRVGYWWSQERCYVDVHGMPLDESPTEPGQVVTAIQRGGSPIAIVEHRDTTDPDVLVGELRPRVLLALDNERLRATQLAQLRDLRASRARICEVGDAERRRLERDLHDGAQQHLLAIAFELRVARLAAARGGEDDRATRLATAEGHAMAIVDELRRICRGIHPQVLSQTGLVPALESLAEESSIPIEVRAHLVDRLPVSVETAAYALAVEALDQAGHRGSTTLTIDLDDRGDELMVEASDSRPEPLVAPARLADRVGAVGGELTSGVSARGAFLRAVLPCG